MKATKELMKAAICELEQINSRIQRLEDRTERTESEKADTEEYIYLSWLIELQLAKDSKETLENWIFDLEFDI